MISTPTRRLLVLSAAFVAGVAVCASVVMAQAPGNPADAIVGDWRPADMNVNVRIFPSNGQYLGGIVKADKQELLNKELMRGIAFDPTSGTWSGEVFAFKLGQFVPMTIKLTPAGFEMVAGSGIMSKTVEWVRVQ
jgi:hypothetical protein